MKKYVALLSFLFVFSINANANNFVLMETNLGDIKIELNTEKAPITTDNFLNYVNKGFYNGLVFHRVIPGFMIQGGGADDQLRFRETDKPIKNEAKNGLKNERGTISMARTNVVDSATSQFFINVADNSFLDYQSNYNYGYAVFGKVISGMDVVEKIESVNTGAKGPHQNVPLTPVYIKKVSVINN